MKRLSFAMSFLLGATLSAGCGGAPEDRGPEETGLTQEGGVSESLASLAGYCDGVNSWDANWANLESQVLTLVNQKRAAGATCGSTYMPKVGAVTLDTRLRCAARVQSKDMGTKNFFSHTGSDGSTPWQRMNNAGYSWTQASENIAAGNATAASVVDSWMKSEGHCKNLMGAGVTNLGVGYFYAASSTYKHYWTQDFGRP